jgi:hypothetical protein
VGLFGGVDQEKKERECTGRHRALLYGESVYLAEKVLEGRRVTVAVASSARGNAQLLDNLERLLAFETLDNAPECTGKPANVLMEREVLRPWLQAPATALQLDWHSLRS